MADKKQISVATARRNLALAIANARGAYGRAQWKNGYRCGAKATEVEDRRLYAHERELLDRANVLDRKVSQAITAYAKAIRAEK